MPMANLFWKDFTAAEKIICRNWRLQKYIILCRSVRADCGDMIIRYSNLGPYPELRANQEEQFQFIMVDEFPGHELAQLRCYSIWPARNDGNPNIMAVGGDDQAIFGTKARTWAKHPAFRQHYHDEKICFDRQLSLPPETFILSAGRHHSKSADRLEKLRLTGYQNNNWPHANSEVQKSGNQEFSSVSEERRGIAKRIAGAKRRKARKHHDYARHHKRTRWNSSASL